MNNQTEEEKVTALLHFYNSVADYRQLPDILTDSDGEVTTITEKLNMVIDFYNNCLINHNQLGKEFGDNYLEEDEIIKRCLKNI